MKKVLFILMISLAYQSYGQQVSSQIPMADKWIALNNLFWREGHPKWSEVTYTLGADTTIDGKTYQCLMENEMTYYGAIRYSADRSQLYYRSHSGEYLLCDFSLNIGDHCALYLSDSPDTEIEQILQKSLGTFTPNWKVESKELIDDRWHMTLSTIITEYHEGEPIFTDTISMEMIQGIGSKNVVFLVYNALALTGWAGSIPRFSLCSYSGEENLYSYDLSPMGIINNCPNWTMDDTVVDRPISADMPVKLVVNGQVLIQRGEKMYDLRGQEVKL